MAGARAATARKETPLIMVMEIGYNTEWKLDGVMLLYKRANN